MPMTFDPTVRAAVIGCGAAGRARIRSNLADFRNTSIDVVCEPSPDAYREAAAIFEAEGRPVPINVPDLERLLGEHAHNLDVAFIVTPHALHFSQTKACLEAGLDVLLEKPMVMNAQEARELIETRDRTGRTLVVSFQGSLSPHIRKAVKMLRSGELGRVQTISGVIWQNWAVISRTGGGGTPVSPAAGSCSTAAPIC
jgi:predicted dehydrogenase